MKHVTFTRDMIGAHHTGEMRLVPDEVAARLEAEGVIAPNPPSYPPGSETAPEAKPASRLRRRARDLLGQSYLVK